MAPPGRRRLSLSPAAIALCLVFLFSSTASAASAVLGVDLGTEYIKAALVKPGIPLEIVLTKDSKRKEASAVAFKPLKSGELPAGSFPERFYGSDAIALTGRFPGDVYPNLKQLLGVPSESDAVKVYNERYPALQVTGTEARKTISLNSGIFAEGERSFSVEELLAMELKNVKDNAKTLAGKGVDVQEVVFTVPPFYNVDERRALEVAARLAGLKVLSMVSDGLAVGMNYATGRTFPVVNEGGSPEVNMVFDMGAGSASATILKFQGRSVKDTPKYNKTVQEIQVAGTGWDRTLGGDSLNSVIVDDMVRSFVELPAAKSASITAEKVKSHGRTAAKLWKEAEKLRQVLSANTATSAFFESLYDDIDFRYKLSRSEFEDLALSYAARVDGPVKQALEAAGLEMSDIDSLIVHGGATRTPFVQSRLEAVAGKSKIRANVNSDEAAVFGAAFKAAGLSPSFRVKEIRDTDTQGYVHGIQYSFNMKDRDQKIFSPASKTGATKDIPFQMMGEFEFTMYQAIPGPAGDVSKEPTLHFKSGNLTRAVTKMIDDDKCDRESFNNYVQVRLSPITGTPEVTAAWVTCETEEEIAKGGIVDGMKNLFGMGGKKDQEPLQEDESASESPTSFSEETSSSTSAEAESTETVKTEKKKKTIKSAITYQTTALGYEKHPRKELKRMQDRLFAFDDSDKSRRVREELLNSLEAFTYRARDYLEDDSFIAASTSDVRSALEEKLSKASDWIYSEGTEATEEALKSKIGELEDIVNPVLKRQREATQRPDAIKELQEAIDGLKSVVPMVKEQIEKQVEAASKKAESASSEPTPSASADSLDDLEDDDMLKASASESADSEATEVPTIYSDEDLKFLEESVAKASKWLEENEAKQKTLKESDEPAFTIKDVQDQSKKLHDAVTDMMMKKARHFKPPKAKATPKSKSKKSKKSTKTETEEATAASQETPAANPNGKQPSQEELDEALEKSGLKAQGVRFKTNEDNSEIEDENGRKLTKLEISEDATEEDIMAAIDRATAQAKERIAKENEGQEHDEL